MGGKLGSLTSPKQRWAEDPLDGLAGTPVTSAHAALVLPQVGAQDAVAAHVLGRAVVGEGVLGSRLPPAATRLPCRLREAPAPCTRR